MRKLVIMRGIPGSGKSTKAKEIASKVDGAKILSTDDFFMVDGEYKFDREKLGDAHGWNYRRFVRAVDDNVPLVIIDNTNIRKSDFKRYVTLANERDYEIEQVVLSIDVETAFSRNVHGVPMETIERMAKSLESSIQNDEVES